MTKVKKILGVAFAALFTIFTCFSYAPVQAARRKTPVIPQVKFVSTPATEYTVGDRVKFNISAPNYGGKVEYRVVLWNDSTKTYSDLWNVSNGYPNRYYKKWQPWGNNVFTLGWPILKEGNYRITVYVKRVGIANSKAFLKGQNCDSYKESVAFTVKPNLSLLNKDGQTYGSNDASKPVAVKTNVNVTAKNVTLNNANVDGNINITGDNAVIKNVTVTGKIVIDPGKDGSATLENVVANGIEVLSGGTNSIHIKSVKAQTLTADSTSPVRIEADGETSIVSTTANGYVIFDKKSGSFGTITITKDENGQTVVEFRGDILDKVLVQTQATIKTAEGSKVEDLVVATPDKVTLDGTFNKLQINSNTMVEVAAGSTIQSITANTDASLTLNSGAVVDTLDDKGNVVTIIGDGEVISGGEDNGGSGEVTVYDANKDLNTAYENFVAKYKAFCTLTGKKYVDFSGSLYERQSNTVKVTVNSTYQNAKLTDLAYASIDKLIAAGTISNANFDTAFDSIKRNMAEVQVNGEPLKDYAVSKLNNRLAGKSYLDEAVAFVNDPSVTTYNALYTAVTKEYSNSADVVAAFHEIFPSITTEIFNANSVAAYGLTLDSVKVDSVTFYSNGTSVDMSKLLANVKTVYGKDLKDLTVNDVKGKTVVVRLKSSSGDAYTYYVEIATDTLN